jgi:hypothetical protein
VDLLDGSKDLLELCFAELPCRIHEFVPWALLAEDAELSIDTFRNATPWEDA